MRNDREIVMADDPELALVLKILWRLIVITIGFVAAILAAGTALAVGIGRDLAATVDSSSPYALDRHALTGLFLVIGFAGISFIPWVIGTIVAELLAIRSFVYHFGLGAVSGAAASLLYPIPDPHALQIALATGLVAGGVYWLIAGRLAGDWWPRHVRPLYAPKPPPPPVA